MKKDVAVVIHLHSLKLNKYDTFNITNNIEKFKNFMIVFVCPRDVDVKKLGIKLPLNYQVQVFKKKYFKDIKSYSKLLLSKSFYERFLNFKYILICQTDVLILKDELKKWVNEDFDYIGAPWISKDINNNYSILGVGNGGLSLRKVQTHYDVLNSSQLYFDKAKLEALPVWFNLKTILSLKIVNQITKIVKIINPLSLFLWFFYKTDKYINEDVFWCGYAAFFEPNYTIASTKKALEFSFECEPQYCFKINNKKLPFGTHKWYQYNKDFWFENVKELEEIK